MQKRSGYTAAAVCLFGVSQSVVFPAAAQTASPDGVLQEVVVTAQRRAENAQNVPIAISALTSSQIEQQGVLKTDQLTGAIPGLQFTHEVNDATIYIRGVGVTEMETGEEGSTAVYLDDLYIPQGSGSIFQLNSVDSIQVLKGPQGTLFGRNATAGVIQVHTKDPTMTPGLDAHVGYGNYQTGTADIYATGGLTDQLAANFSAYDYDERKGWGHDLYTGERAFQEKDYGARAKVLWTPFADTRILLTGGYNYSRSEVGVGLNQVPGSIGCCANGFVGFFNNVDARNDAAETHHSDVQLKIEQNLDWATLVSITGYQLLESQLRFNQDGSPAALVMNVGDQFGHTFSQELHLLSPADARVKWIGGLFYMHDSSGYDPSKLAGVGLGLPPIDHFPGGDADAYLSTYSTITTRSLAGFGQATYEFLPKTNLTVGLRFTQDKRSYDSFVALSPALGGIESTGVPCATGLCPFTGSKNYDQWTYRAVLDHHFTDDLMVYFSQNRGFKSGEYDVVGITFTGADAEPPVKPEILTSQEIGIKGEFLDHRLKINADAFYYDYSNIQFATVLVGHTSLLNAASAIIKGGEIEIVALPTNQFSISNNISILRGVYKSFANAPDPFVTGCTTAGPILCQFDASGSPTIRSPRFTDNISADYKLPSPIGDFDLNANYTYIDGFNWLPDGSVKQPVTNLVNASVRWTSTNGRWDLRLWGNNLTFAKYYSFVSESSGLGKEFSPAAPRTYGLTAGLHF
jgi:iron complex outermembrane recepter protein